MLHTLLTVHRKSVSSLVRASWVWGFKRKNHLSLLWQVERSWNQADSQPESSGLVDSEFLLACRRPFAFCRFDFVKWSKWQWNLRSNKALKQFALPCISDAAGHNKTSSSPLLSHAWFGFARRMQGLPGAALLDCILSQTASGSDETWHTRLNLSKLVSTCLRFKRVFRFASRTACLKTCLLTCVKLQPKGHLEDMGRSVVMWCFDLVHGVKGMRGYSHCIHKTSQGV